MGNEIPSQCDSNRFRLRQVETIKSRWLKNLKFWHGCKQNSKYMNYPVEQTFRTKTGTCTITHDKIILKRRGVRGAAAKIILGNSIKRVLLLNLLLGIAALLFGIYYFRSRQLANGFFFQLSALFCCWMFYRVLRTQQLRSSIVHQSGILGFILHAHRSHVDTLLLYSRKEESFESA